MSAEKGRVILTGEILSDELDDLIRSVSAVKGVRAVENQLRAHDEPGDISILQGGHSRHGSRYALFQSNWPPAMRFAAGVAGGATTVAGIKQGGILGSILGIAGAVTVILAATNQNVRQMIDRASKTTKTTGQAKTVPFHPRQRKTG